MPNAITIRNGRCTCDCGDVCPLGRMGMQMRCTAKRLAEHGIQMIQKSPNNWSCLPTAFAMALNQPVEAVIKKLGHDGSQKCWPDRPEPECRHGFHPAELIEYCWMSMWVAVTTIEVFPILATAVDGNLDWNTCRPVYRMEQARKRANAILDSVDRGVIGGVTAKGNRHAIAAIRTKDCKELEFFCPNEGQIESVADFKISHIYILGD